MDNTLPRPSTIPLSPHVLDIPQSATLAINEKSKQLILEGQDVIRLGLGQSPFPVPEIMVSALQNYAGTKDYMAVQGYLPLREVIASYIQRSEGLDRSAQDVIIGPGSKELLFDLQMVLDCDLVLPAPSWVSYDPQARLLGRNVHWLPCQRENGWKLHPTTLEQHCKQNPGRLQLLILNSPNNPSGACFHPHELKGLAEVAARYGVIVLSDEIYSELHYRGEHQSIARYYPQGTIISNGISKWAGAGGWRLGFQIFPPELRPVLNSMVTVASETFTSVSAPIQMASLTAFEHLPEMVKYIKTCRNVMRITGIRFSEILTDHGVEVTPPEGGFYNLADFSPFREALLRHGITTSSALSCAMLEATNVAALPGSDFGMQEGLFMRFAFVDFDGNSVMQRVLDNNLDVLEPSILELQRVFTAADRIGDWLHSL